MKKQYKADIDICVVSIFACLLRSPEQAKQCPRKAHRPRKKASKPNSPKTLNLVSKSFSLIQEAVNINQSLFVLRRVITALSRREGGQEEDPWPGQVSRSYLRFG